MGDTNYAAAGQDTTETQNFGKKQWTREMVSSCECHAKPYRHVHCPCKKCKGRATNRTTEKAHWDECQILCRRTRQKTSQIHSIQGMHWMTRKSSEMAFILRIITVTLYTYPKYTKATNAEKVLSKVLASQTKS